MTIKEIAKLANVSTATVSRIINNKEAGYSQETKEIVLKIIKDMNYSPNSIARGMVTNKTFTIGLVIQDIENPYFPKLVRGIEKVANENGYFILLCNTDGDIEREAQYISFLKEKRVDGIILTTSNGNDDEYISKLIEGEIEFVFVDEIARNVSCVNVDNKYGSYDATKYLVSLGHSKIACIAGPENSITNQDRIIGYKKALIESNKSVEDNLIYFGTYQEESGYLNMKKILDSREDVTAVFCVNDFNAIGAYNAIVEAGMKVPEDISLIGFDDIFKPLKNQFGLTSVSQPVVELGIESANMLMKKLRGDNSDLQKTLKPKLIIRDSTMQKKD